MVPKILAVATALAFAAQGVVGAGCTLEYTVKEGDTCDKIARDINVSISQLRANNPEKTNNDCMDLMPKDVLCLTTDTDDCQKTYTVREADDCASVSSFNGISTDVLRQYNSQIDADCWNLYTGEVLCVSKEKKAPPTAPSPAAPSPAPPALQNNIPTSLTKGTDGRCTPI